VNGRGISVVNFEPPENLLARLPLFVAGGLVPKAVVHDLECRMFMVHT
jgi:hypothetical protein